MERTPHVFWGQKREADQDPKQAHSYYSERGETKEQLSPRGKHTEEVHSCHSYHSPPCFAMEGPTCLPASAGQPKRKTTFDSNCWPEKVFPKPFCWQLGTEIGTELIFAF